LPALVLELKYNNKAVTAINQIKDKHYTDSLLDYLGEVILIGVNYDKRTKKHQCSIERITKETKCMVKKFGESSEKILHLLKQNPMLTIAELSEKLSMTTRGVEKNLKKLQSAGRLTRVGPDKGGWWKVRIGN